MRTTLIILCMLLSTITFSQETFERGRFDINVGAGFPNKVHATSDVAGSLFNIDADSGSSSPFFMVSGEYRINERYGIGPYVGYFKGDSEILGVVSIIDQILGNGNVVGNTSYSVTSVGIRLAAYRKLFDVPKLYTYASTILGYNFVKDESSIQLFEDDLINSVASSFISEINYPTISYEVNIGAKYYVADQIALYLEGGIGNYLLNAGAVYSMDK